MSFGVELPKCNEGWVGLVNVIGGGGEEEAVDEN